MPQLPAQRCSKSGTAVGQALLQGRHAFSQAHWRCHAAFLVGGPQVQRERIAGQTGESGMRSGRPCFNDVEHVDGGSWAK